MKLKEPRILDSSPSAAELRKIVATAEGRGSLYENSISRGSGVRFLRRCRGSFHLTQSTTACRPWLQSFAAPRLKVFLVMTVLLFLVVLCSDAQIPAQQRQTPSAA